MINRYLHLRFMFKVLYAQKLSNINYFKYIVTNIYIYISQLVLMYHGSLVSAVSILSKRNALANVKIGEPVGCAGRSPALPAMSK